MKFEWDPVKSSNCYTQRGFDFAYATEAFLDPACFIKSDVRWDYGEDRYQLFGAIEKRVFVLSFTIRGEIIRLISARKANLREVKIYENNSLENQF